MNRHQFLKQLHRLAKPRNYLEIGVNRGTSLALSRVPTIAVDPAFGIIRPLQCDLQLVRETSDDFFARRDPIHHLRSGRNPFRNMRRGRAPLGHYIGGGPILDLAFLDGMHLFEYTLRDFMNTERHCGWTSLIVIDDMLPRNAAEAARTQPDGQWAGDVYKLGPVLREHRPDLVVLSIDTEPTGVAVVLGADPSSGVLRASYERLVERWAVPDPQTVPHEILERRGAISPERFLASPILPLLLRSRGDARRRGRGYEQLHAEALTLAVS